MTRPLLAVVHDLGSAAPLKVLSAAAGLADVVFVCDRERPHVDEGFPELVATARVLDVTGAGPDGAVELVARLAPAGVTTFSEAQLGLTAAIAWACGLPFHSPDTVRLLTDKSSQRDALASTGVQATRCIPVRDSEEALAAAARIGPPVVLKPRSGAGSTDTCRVDTLAAGATLAATLFADGREFVVEELLEGDPDAAGPFWGDYVSVESVVCGGCVQRVCVTGKFALAEPFRETGMFLPATIPTELATAVVELEQAALRALGVRQGVTHTEIKLTPDGPRVIEVNGRLGGYVGEILQRAAGYDLTRAAVRLALGEPFRVPPIRYRQLSYQYFVTAPPDAARLLSLSGIDQLLDLPGVLHVDTHATPGQRVDWRDGTQGHLAVVYGTATDHAALRATIAEIDARIHLQYASDSVKMSR